MALLKGYRQFMDDENEATTEIRGSGVIVLTALSGGTWQLIFVAPDDTEIVMQDEITEPLQQCFENAPETTRLRIRGSGANTAKAWIGQAFNEAEGILL